MGVRIRLSSEHPGARLDVIEREAGWSRRRSRTFATAEQAVDFSHEVMELACHDRYIPAAEAAGLLGVTQRYLATVSRVKAAIDGCALYDARKFPLKFCSRVACKRPFRSLNRRKTYCSPKCARRVATLKAQKNRRARERVT